MTGGLDLPRRYREQLETPPREHVPVRRCSFNRNENAAN